MQAMQYKIGLPEDYDMDIIRKRVQDSGHKMDGFDDLLFKAFLISEKATGAFENSYSPLYVWKNTYGMNKFIFEGFYDNIIKSFGWQHIEIGVTAEVDLSSDFSKSRYLIEDEENILPQKTLTKVDFTQKKEENALGYVQVYNPDKWIKKTYTFFESLPENLEAGRNIYTILHLSQGK
ncbi:DUF4865 family protein [Streptococcaceae bacterium ESL0687]|nr:DUF4865 family protein [Streptococcaceae bacterium ESL0687]